MSCRALMETAELVVEVDSLEHQQAVKAKLMRARHDAVAQGIDPALSQRVRDIEEAIRGGEEGLALMRSSDLDGGNGEWLTALTTWRRCAYPTLDPSHRLAASLMSTSLRGIGEGLRMPWDAFAILVPQGLLRADDDDEGGPFDVTSILVHGDGGRVEVGVHGTKHGSGSGDDLLRLYHPATTLMELLADPEDLHEQNPRTACKHDLSSRNVRVLTLVGRLVVGSILELTTMGTNGSSGPRAKKPGREGEPRLWVFKMLRAVKVDARPIVAAYLAGGGRSPTVQSLVRGHWKNQPHGPCSSLRKWIHVEPFWRGPEDAPIAVRAHRMGAES